MPTISANMRIQEKCQIDLRLLLDVFVELTLDSQSKVIMFVLSRSAQGEYISHVVRQIDQACLAKIRHAAPKDHVIRFLYYSAFRFPFATWLHPKNKA